MLLYIIEYMSYTSTIFRILNYDTLSDEDKSIMIDVINKWETNKETPNNSEIAKIEKILGVKLPRCKKVKVNKDE